jgi:hypothetical protein
MEEHVKKELQVGNILVIPDTHRLGKACGIGINLLVSGVLGIAVSKTHLGLHHSIYLLEVMFGAPKAPSCQINLFHI